VARRKKEKAFPNKTTDIDEFFLLFFFFRHRIDRNHRPSSGMEQIMANLNFQQPPRIPSASLSRSTNSGFTSNSISGNVTPTSLMFQSSQQQPVSNSSYVTTQGQQQQQNQQQSQQLSPNRAGQMAIGGNIVAPPMGNRRMFNPALQQRMGGGLGSGSMNMGSFMQSARYGSQSGVGGINNFFASSETPPTLLDMSEFPSLTNARHDQHSNVLQAPGSKPYGESIASTLNDSYAQSRSMSHFVVGMVKQPTSEQTEFQMSSEDFPALPGTSDNLAGVVGSGSSAVVGNQSHQSSVSASSVMSSNNVIGSGGHHHQMSTLGGMMSVDGSGMMDNKNSIGSNLCMDMMQSETVVGHQSVGGHHHLPSEKAKRGVQTSPNGLVTNIPPTMVNNQFGMIGLLTFIRAAESDPNLVSLAMGQDLTALGLNLNSMENLYQSFGGPFSDGPAR
jgi:CCR4-NOT transcription complex subunit 2